MPAPIKTHLKALLAQFFAQEGLGDKNNLRKFFRNRFLVQKMPFLLTFCLNYDNSGFTSEFLKKRQKPVKMCQKLLIIISNNYFWVLDTNCSHFSPKKAQKLHFPIRSLVLLMTKMLQKPLFLPFQAPVRVWKALSQIFGKSQIFSGHLDHKKVPKT